jgi:tRNA 2-selenouridine synthase
MVIDIPLQERIRYLVDTYGEQPAAGLEDSVRKLERRLGNESMKQALKALAEGDLEEVVRITLRYYDKAYDHGIHVRPAHLTTHISYEGKDHEYIAADLIGRSQNYFI